MAATGKILRKGKVLHGNKVPQDNTQNACHEKPVYTEVCFAETRHLTPERIAAAAQCLS